jgi:ubiquinone/menaquinone biosynthesis C-methylase UbiE
MLRATGIPIVNPTVTEEKIWQHLAPEHRGLKKMGGMIRQGSATFPHEMFACCFGPRDKANPDHWDCKMKGGPRAEWWAYMMEGADRILDVGCGFGFPAFYLASYGQEVVGVDPSPSQIAVAERYRREEGASYRLKYLVIEQALLPFRNNSFDGATFSSSLECVGDPETLIQEVIRILKPGSTVAVDDEDRGTEPRTHPVWERRRITVIDDVAYLYVETRVCDPYLDRRYMIRLLEDGPLTAEFRRQAPTGSFTWEIELEETGLSLEQVLSEAVEGEYGEARGYDAYTLADFFEGAGFTDLRFWTHNEGRKFAEELQAAGVLTAMPDDIRAVSRALVRSIPPRSAPPGLISCKSP